MSNDGSMFNFCGPGTRLISRLKRGDEPIDILDEQCLQHDIDYRKAKNVTDIDKADQKLINAMDKIEGKNPVKNIIKYGMKGKKKAHELGLPRNAFTGRSILQDGKSFDLTKKDKDEVKELQQMGLGKKKKKKSYKIKIGAKPKILNLDFEDTKPKKYNKKVDPLKRLKNKVVYI